MGNLDKINVSTETVETKQSKIQKITESTKKALIGLVAGFATMISTPAEAKPVDVEAYGGVKVKYDDETKTAIVNGQEIDLKVGKFKFCNGKGEDCISNYNIAKSAQSKAELEQSKAMLALSKEDSKIVEKINDLSN